MENNKKEMGTTIISFYNPHTGSWFLGADTQVTEGSHRIMPDKLCKIFEVDNNILCSGTGSVSDISNIIKKVLRGKRIEKAMADNLDFKINFKEFVNEISELLFDYRRSAYANEINCNYLTIGYDELEKTTKCYSLSSDGALMEIKSFYSDGSGGDFAISQLNNLWVEIETKPKSDLEVGEILYEAISQTSTLDLFTNACPDIFIMKKDGTKEIFIPEDILSEIEKEKQEVVK